MSNYVCEELFVEILTRLPPKSLLRFRSLSKWTCRCISSPGFIRIHTFRSPRKIRFEHLNTDKNKKLETFYTLHGEDELPLCLCPNRGYIGITTPVLYPCSTNFRTMISCNGTYFLWTKNDWTLWNPSIRRKLRVPKCPQKSEPILEGIGFGFDSVSDDYKIVWISGATENSFVYAVKTGEWCEIASPKPQFNDVGSLNAYLFNGVLHWEVWYPTEENEKYGHLSSYSYILTFDLSTHVFGMIPLPAPTWIWITTGLTTIQGSLALISHCFNIDDSWIRVWRDASWSVVFKLNYADHLVAGALQLQPTTNNGDLLLYILDERNWVQVYNPTTGVRSRVVDFNAASGVVDYCQCVETLHLLDMGETVCETDQL